MADELELTAEIIMTFMVENATTNVCPFCQGGNWIVEIPPGSVVHLICEECAFIRPLSAKLIREWRAGFN